mgnify:CR=1 FL=1
MGLGGCESEGMQEAAPLGVLQGGYVGRLLGLPDGWPSSHEGLRWLLCKRGRLVYACVSDMYMGLWMRLFMM